MATPRPSFTKRQRENAKREKQLAKAAKRAARKLGGGETETEIETVPATEGDTPPADSANTPQ